MIEYRIKHNGTGMYYCPLRTIPISMGDRKGAVKTNLSRNGKLYNKKPTLASLGKTFFNHMASREGQSVSQAIKESDWTIEEMPAK